MKLQSSDSGFPEKLDGAKVLFYTPQGDYGKIKYPNGEIADYFRYLAICRYANDKEYYLFCCDETYEVVSDSPWDSIDQCMNIAASYKENIVWQQAE